MKSFHPRAGVLAAAALLMLASSAAFAQQTTTATAPTTQSTTTTTAAAGELRGPGEVYESFVLLPALVTIVLAMLLRQVLPALSIGVLIAAFMRVPCLPPEDAFGGGIIGAIRLAIEGYLIGALYDKDHIKVILFSLTIGGMVGIVAANGGTHAIVTRVARWASNRRRGQLATFFAGLVIFFDDYANSMIIGPAMRPICDRLRISRAKLSYIVDSTAAPVASLALIGTWIGVEVSLLQDGLSVVRDRPEWLAGAIGYNLFIASIPYRFYVILALVLVFFVAWLGRDFGPMLRAERAAAQPTSPGAESDAAAAPRVSAWLAGLPILVLVVTTIALLVTTGWLGVPAAERPGDVWGLVRAIVPKMDSFNSILYGAIASLVVAALLSVLTGALSVRRTVEGAADAMARMLSTIIVLVLAWSFSSGMSGLQLAEVTRGLLTENDFDVTWLPLLIFVAACVVSFATGTSWGTMAILCPATVTISAGLLSDRPAAEAAPLFYGAVGSVLAGAVFGDHCSPISDTTVLSSLASDCTLEEHVWTQAPYALTAAAASIVGGYVLCHYAKVDVWVGLLAGAALLLLVVRIIGRRPARVPA